MKYYYDELTKLEDSLMEKRIWDKENPKEEWYFKLGRSWCQNPDYMLASYACINNNFETISIKGYNIEAIMGKKKFLDDNRDEFIKNGCDIKNIEILYDALNEREKDLRKGGGVYDKLDVYINRAREFYNGPLVRKTLHSLFVEEFFVKERGNTNILDPRISEILYLEFGEWKYGNWHRCDVGEEQNAPHVGLGFDSYYFYSKYKLKEGVEPIKVIHRGERGRHHHDDSFYVFKR